MRRAAEEWRVGDVRVVRAGRERGPMSRERASSAQRAPGRRRPWLRPRWQTRRRPARLLGARLRGRRRRAALRRRHVRRQRQGPPQSVLERAARARSWRGSASWASRRLDRPGAVHAPAPRPRGLEHAARRTARGSPPSRDARYLMARDEWEHAARGPPSRARTCSAIRCARSSRRVSRISSRPITRVSACVSLEPTPGHTPGHVACASARAARRP